MLINFYKTRWWHQDIETLRRPNIMVQVPEQKAERSFCQKTGSLDNKRKLKSVKHHLEREKRTRQEWSIALVSLNFSGKGAVSWPISVYAVSSWYLCMWVGRCYIMVNKNVAWGGGKNVDLEAESLRSNASSIVS